MSKPIRTGDNRPVAFHEVRQDQLPFRLRFLDETSGELLHEILVTGAGGIDVPGFRPRRVRVEVVWPNGEVTTAEAPAEAEGS